MSGQPLYRLRHGRPVLVGSFTEPPLQVSPPPPLTVALSFEREDGGSGVTIATFHVPVADGVLTAAKLAAKTQRLYIGGIEQAVYVEGRGKYASGGNPRFLYGEVSLNVATGVPIVAEVRFDQGARGLSDLTKTWLTFENPITHLPIQGTDAAGILWLGRARAVGLPTSAAYMCGTGALGPMVTKAVAVALPGVIGTNWQTHYDRLDTWLRDFHWDGNASTQFTNIHTGNSNRNGTDLTLTSNVDATFASQYVWDPGYLPRPPNFYNWRATGGAAGFSGGQNYYGADAIFFTAFFQIADRAYFRRATPISWMNQYYYRYVYAENNQNNPTLAIDTNFDVKTTNGCDYWIAGVGYSLASSTSFDTGTTASIATTKWGIALLSANAAGTKAVTWATNGGAGYADEATALASLPALPGGHGSVGYVTVQAGGATWTAGTSALAGGTGGTPAAITNYVKLTPGHVRLSPYSNQTGAYQMKGWGMQALFGDNDALDGLEATANREFGNTLLGDWSTSSYGEPRPQARIMEARLWAWAAGGTLQDWASSIEDAVTRARTGTSWMHDPNLAPTWGNQGNDESCSTGTPAANGAHLFMNALLVHAMAESRDLYTAMSATNSTGIMTRVKAHLDYIYDYAFTGHPTNSTQPAGFWYKTGDCVVSPQPATDIANLFPQNWAWYAARSGDGVYTSLYDRLFPLAVGTLVDPGTTGPLLNGQKNSRENYHVSLHGAAYRSIAPAGLPIPSDALLVVTVTGASTSSVGGTAQYAAEARVSTNGFFLPKTFTWDTSDHALATVDATGFVTFLSAGTVNVTATTGGLSGSKSVTIAALQFQETWSSNSIRATLWDATTGTTGTGSASAATGKLIIATTSAGAGNVEVLFPGSTANRYSLTTPAALTSGFVADIQSLTAPGNGLFVIQDSTGVGFAHRVSASGTYDLGRLAAGAGMVNSRFSVSTSVGGGYNATNHRYMRFLYDGLGNVLLQTSPTGLAASWTTLATLANSGPMTLTAFGGGFSLASGSSDNSMTIGTVTVY